MKQMSTIHNNLGGILQRMWSRGSRAQKNAFDMVSLNNIQKEAKSNMLFRKARIDGKTNEKQGNDCHNIGLEGTSAGKAGILIKER